MYGTSNSHPHCLPTPVERGSLFPSSTRFYLTDLPGPCLNQLLWPGRQNTCSSLELEVVESALLQTNSSKMGQVSTPKENQVFLPENRRVVMGLETPTVVHHSFLTRAIYDSRSLRALLQSLALSIVIVTCLLKH